MRPQLPQGPALIVLIGMAGSGKSTLARELYPGAHILSSDHMRYMLTDDEDTQGCSADAFAMLEQMARMRLKYGRAAVIDATNVRARARAQWLDLAAELDVPCVALWVDVAADVCKARQAGRARKVPDHVIERQSADLAEIQGALLEEAWDGIVRARPKEQGYAYEELRGFAPRRVRAAGTRGVRVLDRELDIIGDVHGCADELDMLLERLSWRRDDAGQWSHPEGRTLVFVGDLVDRGPASVRVVERVSELVEQGRAFLILGNHDDKVRRYLRGNKLKVDKHLQTTVDELDRMEEAERAAFTERALALLEPAPMWALFDPDDSTYGGRLVVAHAAWKPSLRFAKRDKVRWYCLYGPSTGELNEHGYPERIDWRPRYPEDAPLVVTGHTPFVGPIEQVGRHVCVDTACVFGGALSAWRWPEREVVEVKALQVWSEHSSELGAQPTYVPDPRG